MKYKLRAEIGYRLPAGSVPDVKSLAPSGHHVGGNGVVEPAQREAKLAGSVAGRVAAILVKEGDRVPAGTVLVRLETGVEESALAAAKADADAARAELTRSLQPAGGPPCRQG